MGNKNLEEINTQDRCEKMKYPVLKIDTINNKYSIDNIDIGKKATSLSVSLEGGNSLGIVRIEFLSDVVIEGELINDIEFKKKLNEMKWINKLEEKEYV